MIFPRVNRSPGSELIAVHESKFATIFYTATLVNPHHPMDTQFTLLTATFLWHFSTTTRLESHP